MQPFFKMWAPFLTQDINLHFRILFIAKFKLFKLHSKVRSFERMFEFNQVHLGPIMEYSNVAIMGASATLLSRLDTVQNVATSLCRTSFILLWCCHHTPAVELLLKLLDRHCCELLQTFCPNFSTLKFDIA